jgi:hypothetical protein
MVMTLREGHRLRVSENRVLRTIFAPKREEVATYWRRLHNEFHNLYASPNVIRVIKSRRMEWAEHVARLEKMRYGYKVFVRRNQKGSDHLVDLDVDGDNIKMDPKINKS